MDIKPLLDKLDMLAAERNAWNTMGTRQRLNARVGTMLLVIVDDPAAGTKWRIEVFGTDEVVQEWSHAASVVDAMKHTTVYTRAALQGTHQPVHLEH